MKTPQIPIPKLSGALGVGTEVWFKREDKHKYGSHKGRSIPLMIDEAFDNGKTKFVVSSSGNAGLAAVRAIQSHNRNNKGEKIFLKIFVGHSIPPDKLALIKKEITDERISIEQVDNPKQHAIQLEKTGEAFYLRQSTNDTALLGYEELASELGKIENLAAVFIPTSSGTTAQGLHAGFAKLGINPQIHIIQTTSCHPLADAVLTMPYSGNDETSLASAVVDKTALRKEKVSEAIKNSHGTGWIATNEDILKAVELTKQTSDLTISPNAALSVAGLQLAVAAGQTWSGPVVCLITGL